MSRPKTTAAALKQLSDEGDGTDKDQATETLRAALSSGTSAVVAQAAELAGRLALPRLARDLCTTFERFSGDGMRADRYCAAKVAIVNALRQLKIERAAPYLSGMTCYWPARPNRGSRDTAAELRIAAAYAHSELGSALEVDELAGLLADPTEDVRLAAVHCVAALGGAICGPLLRLKILLGDDSPSVMAAGFEEILACDKVKHFSVVADYLDSEDSRVRAHAALAIGQSRAPGALEILTAKWRSTFDDDFKPDLLIAIALLRDDRAVEFLLSLLEEHRSTARDALAALAHCHMPRVRQQVEEAIERISDRELRRQFEELF